MSKTTKKFIESHWLTFAMKGAISVVAGMCLMFANGWNTEILIHIVGWTMIGLGLIELINMVHRSHKQANWGFPLFLGLLEIAIAIVLLMTTIPGLRIEQQIPFRIATLSGYVLFGSNHLHWFCKLHEHDRPLHVDRQWHAWLCPCFCTLCWLRLEHYNAHRIIRHLSPNQWFN